MQDHFFTIKMGRLSVVLLRLLRSSDGPHAACCGHRVADDHCRQAVATCRNYEKAAFSMQLAKN